MTKGPCKFHLLQGACSSPVVCSAPLLQCTLGTRMEQIKRSTLFVHEAALLLPGFLCCFNIADFKRRNGHLGHLVGDADIAELDGLIAAMARADGTAQRIGGDAGSCCRDREPMIASRPVLDRYRLAQQFVSGWRIWASRAGQERVAEARIETVIRRAVRCLYTEVASEAELASAIAAFEEIDWALPVNRPQPLSEVPAMPRQRWRCVDQYPEQDPACPFCGSQQFRWEDGDGCAYSGDGTCKGCDADISIHDVT
jgi:GGDEF domain-containing protein